MNTHNVTAVRINPETLEQDGSIAMPGTAHIPLLEIIVRSPVIVAMVCDWYSVVLNIRKIRVPIKCAVIISISKRLGNSYYFSKVSILDLKFSARAQTQLWG